MTNITAALPHIGQTYAVIFMQMYYVHISLCKCFIFDCISKSVFDYTQQEGNTDLFRSRTEYFQHSQKAHVHFCRLKEALVQEALVSLDVLSVSENMADGASLCPQWQMSYPKAAVDVCTPILPFFPCASFGGNVCTEGFVQFSHCTQCRRIMYCFLALWSH